MIFIRQKQLDAFKHVAQSNLERKSLLGLKQHFPHCEEMYTETARVALVRLGADRATPKGLDTETDVQRFLWVMMLFGSYWERDPQFAWAAALLAPNEATTPAERMGRLWNQALAWRERVMGANDVQFLSALRGVESKSMPALCDASSRSQRDLLLQLASIYPQKYREVGDSALQDLTRFAADICKPLDLLDRRAVALITQLMFLFGAGVISDPLHSWAAEALKRTHGGSVEQRLEVLVRAANAQISRMLR